MRYPPYTLYHLVANSWKVRRAPLLTATLDVRTTKTHLAAVTKAVVCRLESSSVERLLVRLPQDASTPCPLHKANVVGTALELLQQRVHLRLVLVLR